MATRAGATSAHEASDERAGAQHTPLGDERKQALVNAAYHLIAERGMEGLRLRDVAARAGMHHATLHYYFPTKPDLIKAVADQLGREFISSPAPGMPNDWQRLAARDALHWYFVTTEHQLRTTPERFVVICELLLHARRSDETRAILAADTTWMRQLAPLLSAGVSSGEFRADLDIPGVIIMMNTFSMGLPLLISIQPDTPSTAIAQFEQALLAYVSSRPTPTAEE